MTTCRVLYLSDSPGRTQICGEFPFQVSYILTVQQACLTVTVSVSPSDSQSATDTVFQSIRTMGLLLESKAQNSNRHDIISCYLDSTRLTSQFRVDGTVGRKRCGVQPIFEGCSHIALVWDIRQIRSPSRN